MCVYIYIYTKCSLVRDVCGIMFTTYLPTSTLPVPVKANFDRSRFGDIYSIILRWVSSMQIIFLNINTGSKGTRPSWLESSYSPLGEVNNAIPPSWHWGVFECYSLESLSISFPFTFVTVQTYIHTYIRSNEDILLYLGLLSSVDTRWASAAAISKSSLYIITFPLPCQHITLQPLQHRVFKKLFSHERHHASTITLPTDDIFFPFDLPKQRLVRSCVSR